MLTSSGVREATAQMRLYTKSPVETDIAAQTDYEAYIEHVLMRTEELSGGRQVVHGGEAGPVQG